jgi:late competence protein required for DNA uptake (superfamily II DNA/RNA helicase)
MIDLVIFFSIKKAIHMGFLFLIFAKEKSRKKLSKIIAKNSAHNRDFLLFFLKFVFIQALINCFKEKLSSLTLV